MWLRAWLHGWWYFVVSVDYVSIGWSIYLLILNPLMLGWIIVSSIRVPYGTVSTEHLYGPELLSTVFHHVLEQINV